MGGFPPLDIGVGDARGVKSAAQERAFVAWLEAARLVAFDALARQAKHKREHHAPAPVTPLVFGAGGAIFKDDDAALPCPGDRNGRHWMRVELSTILLKYLARITWQLRKCRSPRVVPIA